MDTLIKLTDVGEKYDINISSDIQYILKRAEDINKLLLDTNKMIINYTNDDLVCMNNITMERIDKLEYLFIDEFRIFCMNLAIMDDNMIDLYVMEELMDIFINQELSLLRLDDLLTKDMNDYIKNKKSNINSEANKILQEYNVLGKINNYINNYINKSKDTTLEKYMNEIVNNIFPSKYIDITPTDYNIDNLTEFIEKKYNNVQIIKNDDNFFKWREDVILYEISNNNNKIYIYVDNKKREDKTYTHNILDIDISKTFCIINNDDNMNKINNYICTLIEKYIL